MMILWTNEPLIKRQMMRWAGTSLGPAHSLTARRGEEWRRVRPRRALRWGRAASGVSKAHGSSGIGLATGAPRSVLRDPRRLGLDQLRLSPARSRRIPIAAALVPARTRRRRG